MSWDNMWVRVAVVLIAGVGSAALFTRIIIWLADRVKAWRKTSPMRKVAEEMELAEKARDLQEGKSPYTSYEQWRKDVLSDKPLSEIIGRVPEGFFEKKPEQPKGAAGCSGPGGVSGFSGYSGYVGIGPQGPIYIAHLAGQGAQAAADSEAARHRLEEIRARMAKEEDKTVKDKMDQIRQQMIGATSYAPFYSPLLTLNCPRCDGSGYVQGTNIMGMPMDGVPCSACRKR